MSVAPRGDADGTRRDKSGTVVVLKRCLVATHRHGHARWQHKENDAHLSVLRCLAHSWFCLNCHPSHCPLVGRALNWQGQPHAQLQLPISSPLMRHAGLVGAVMNVLPLDHLHSCYPSAKLGAPTRPPLAMKEILWLLASLVNDVRQPRPLIHVRRSSAGASSRQGTRACYELKIKGTIRSPLRQLYREIAPNPMNPGLGRCTLQRARRLREQV